MIMIANKWRVSYGTSMYVELLKMLFISLLIVDIGYVVYDRNAELCFYHLLVKTI